MRWVHQFVALAVCPTKKYCSLIRIISLGIDTARSLPILKEKCQGICAIDLDLGVFYWLSVGGQSIDELTALGMAHTSYHSSQPSNRLAIDF